MIDNNLKIISWNCKSLHNKLSQFIVNIYISRSHIICSNETWLKPDLEPNLINYISFCYHRISLTGRGMLTLVRNDLHCMLREFESYKEGKFVIQCIAIFSTKHKLTL